MAAIDVDVVDPAAALRALGYESASAPIRVTGGWDTLLWRFQTPDGRHHALRVYHLPQREEIVRRERSALAACASAGLPAPRLETAGRVQGLPALVLSWCNGEPLLSAIEKRPWAVWRLGRIFGATQARLHAVTPPPELVATAPGDWLSRVSDDYSDLAEHALSLQPATSSLIHMDFHPLNIIFDGKAVTGVIDWAGAAAGDPRADLARTVVTMLAAPIPPGPMRPLLNVARRLVLRAWRFGYQSVAGPMPDYRPLLAWAGATFLLEMELVIGESHVWETEDDVQTMRRRIQAWAQQAGIR